MLELWRSALDGLVVRHPDPARTVTLDLLDGPLRLAFSVLNTPDTRDAATVYPDFAVSTVQLECWPGMRLARAWIAAAWTGYICHEALELVTLTDLVTRPIDPHGDVLFDRGLRAGLPVTLTMESLERALHVVMPPDVARRFMEAS